MVKKGTILITILLCIVFLLTFVSVAKQSGRGTGSNIVTGSRERKVIPTGTTVLDKNLIEANKKLANIIGTGKE